MEEHTLTQDQAYDRLLRWAAETYNSANDVIQLQDRNTGAIVVKGAVKPERSTVLMYYTMTIDAREHRVRFRQRFNSFEGSFKGDWVADFDAERLNQHFAALRASAMAALNSTDNF